MSDMDLYVEQRSRDGTMEVLRRLGFYELPARDQAGPEELRTALALRRDGASEVERQVVDLHWSLDPVERLLPRRDREVPRSFWENIAVERPIPAPRPEYHAAMLAHHLVHTDLLHVRNLLDLAYEFASMSEDGGEAYLSLCSELRIGRFAAAAARIMDTEFGIHRRGALVNAREHAGQLDRDLNPDRWMRLVATSHPHDDEVITVARIRRRLRLIDRGGARTLLSDLFFPPKTFLRWRWPEYGVGRARLKHYGQVVRKALQW